MFLLLTKRKAGAGDEIDNINDITRIMHVHLISSFLCLQISASPYGLVINFPIFKWEENQASKYQFSLLFPLRFRTNMNWIFSIQRKTRKQGLKVSLMLINTDTGRPV